MKLTLTGLLFVLHGLTSGGIVVQVHIYVTTPMNCTFAQMYCRKFYKNLSVVSNYEDLQMLEKAAGGTYPNSWIRNQENSCKSLKYEDTRTSAVQYLFENPPYCAFSHSSHWMTGFTSCLIKLPFFCYENFILVQEKKTWEEALVYCRSYYTDLASFNIKWPLNQIRSATGNAQTDSVWMGLRFLDGTWNWLNSKTDHSAFSLPSCPPEPYRCGARNVNTEIWENRDCEERLNFLCLNK